MSVTYDYLISAFSTVVKPLNLSIKVQNDSTLGPHFYGLSTSTTSVCFIFYQAIDSSYLDAFVAAYNSNVNAQITPGATVPISTYKSNITDLNYYVRVAVFVYNANINVGIYSINLLTVGSNAGSYQFRILNSDTGQVMGTSSVITTDAETNTIIDGLTNVPTSSLTNIEIQGIINETSGTRSIQIIKTTAIMAESVI